MTDHHLPEDLARWPSDPYELLGIDAGVDQRGLKKAYANLIRKFKPEHYPAQFARIRAAFERVQSRLDMLASWREHELERSSHDDDLIIAEENLSDSSNERVTPVNDHKESPRPRAGEDSSYDPVPIPESKRQDPTRPSRETWEQGGDSLEDAWNTILAGDADRGYLQLVKLSQSPAVAPEVFVRLYWVQRLFPKLETPHPAHWLVLALRRSRLRGPAWELYCHELERHPNLVSVYEHQSLLGHAASPERLFDLLEQRWKAMVRDDRWNLVEQDLFQVRVDVKERSIETWARILFRAVDLAAWSSNGAAQAIVRLCATELDELTELHFRLNHEFQRYDHVLAILDEARLDQIEHEADEIEQIETVTREFTRLVRDTWTESLYVLTPRIKLMLERWVKNPRRALAMLTVLRNRASVAFYHLCSVIRRLDLDDTDRYSPDRPELIRGICQQFLRHRRSMSYVHLREELLEFCIANGIEVGEILAICDATLETVLVERTREALRNDLELEILVRGVLAFWAE